MSVPPPPPSLDQIVKNQKVFFKAQYSLKIQEPPPISGNHTKSSNDTFVKTDGKDVLSKRIQIATHFHTGLNCGKGCMIFLDHENELTHANTLLQFGGTPNENRSLTFGCDDICI
ncbi:hypothetical protein C9374_010367 [Naegleria lovaniensis]|uniref:Uncharacterized protein n=1 Tax=Naegleria lovaniensis TaxID=51637 RepID=A0AA88GGZ0_NAELO|nr:uncharacterized protein C9374_010367 [Naegleria lovaniensis]KAG2374993.1 hypothetical protein C9374_010367 [Naegleria lovaniensis]